MTNSTRLNTLTKKRIMKAIEVLDEILRLDGVEPEEAEKESQETK